MSSTAGTEQRVQYCRGLNDPTDAAVAGVLAARGGCSQALSFTNEKGEKKVQTVLSWRCVGKMALEEYTED